MTETFDKAHFIEILEALHKDQTGLAAALVRVLDIVNGYDWLAEGGRGSHEWNDDDYYHEIGRCLDAIRNEVETSLHDSGGKAHLICCDKYRHVGRYEKVPVQRRIRMAQIYPEVVDELMDFALITGEE